MRLRDMSEQRERGLEHARIASCFAESRHFLDQSHHYGVFRVFHCGDIVHSAGRAMRQVKLITGGCQGPPTARTEARFVNGWRACSPIYANLCADTWQIRDTGLILHLLDIRVNQSPIRSIAR